MDFKFQSDRSSLQIGIHFWLFLVIFSVCLLIQLLCTFYSVVTGLHITRKTYIKILIKYTLKNYHESNTILLWLIMVLKKHSDMNERSKVASKLVREWNTVNLATCVKHIRLQNTNKTITITQMSRWNTGN